MKFSLTYILFAVVFAYIAHSTWVLYQLFNPKPCTVGQCLKAYAARNHKLEMQVYTSKKQTQISETDLTLVWKNDNFDIHKTEERNFNISIPNKTRRNGTLYVHVFVLPKNADPFATEYVTHRYTALTTYMLPQAQFINLLQDRDNNKSSKSNTQGRPVTHWRQKLTISVMEDTIAFDRFSIPAEIFRYMTITRAGEYLPIVYIDELSLRTKDLLEVNSSTTTLPLTLTYTPISVGKLRMWANVLESFKMLRGLGFTEKDTDEIKGIFSDTNFYFLILTFTVAVFHLLFDFLAFKNEISYWKERKDMVGLSSRAVIWRCVSTIVIFMYLMDENTSLLVLIPAGIGTLIEVWKVKKAFKIKVVWSGIIPSFEFGEKDAREKETEAFDSQAMKYLLYVLYPLCILGAGYSLLYVQHRSWYSWVLQSLVNGVYAFGFLFMLPQLFVNYKLKSVAHLPWRAFMYKAFNTFIDDIFAFIITMPTAHRLACFRDDLVFLVYLYQRWLYPVDKTRVNEFGMSYEEEKKDKEESKKTK
ncbi:lipid scramblase CLPTM1L [Patella vulgata]|uniref:lipid scramblase CLPTM1L n=1 Tax=Patella vulgata TaxID=6465 RepID=UPI00217FE8BE|nr:lipid scramblase CLPTM1L [Patella vulgata]XP_050395911.1 lipid scramblase CLPTM1L [Patella vulgata]